MADGALPVLMYHGIHADAGQPGVFDPVYSVHPGDFARQLDWLVANGYRSVRLAAGDEAHAGERRVVITFDDGDVSNAEVALPLLVERGMTAEFFVTSGFVDTPGRLTAAQVRTLAGAGMGVQSHGATHRYLEDLDERALDAELAGSKHELERISAAPVTALALPGGRGGERERLAALRLGYRELLNSAPGCNARRRAGAYLQRLAVTRPLPLGDFAALVQWRGLLPRRVRARYHALRLLKRTVGNGRYERLRERLLTS